MTPKEKADDIYYRFTYYAPLHKNNKMCAWILVNEIMNELDGAGQKLRYNFYREVKEEIEKL